MNRLLLLRCLPIALDCRETGEYLFVLISAHNTVSLALFFFPREYSVRMFTSQCLVRANLEGHSCSEACATSSHCNASAAFGIVGS